jgi:hypothetical protein
MSESGKANLRCVEHAAINEGSLVSQFLGRFAMLSSRAFWSLRAPSLTLSQVEARR